MQPNNKAIPTVNEQNCAQPAHMHPQLYAAPLYPQQPNMIYQQPIDNTSMYPQFSESSDVPSTV